MRIKEFLIAFFLLFGKKAIGLLIEATVSGALIVGYTFPELGLNFQSGSSALNR